MMERIAIPLGDLLADRLNESGGSRPLPEAQIATLREAFERYKGECPFKPGDIVTPRKGYGYRDAGLPHIVLEVLNEPLRNFEVTESVGTSSSGFGMKLDVRVACFTRDATVAAFWQESWCLEPYEGDPAD